MNGDEYEGFQDPKVCISDGENKFLVSQDFNSTVCNITFPGVSAEDVKVINKNIESFTVEDTSVERKFTSDRFRKPVVAQQTMAPVGDDDSDGWSDDDQGSGPSFDAVDPSQLIAFTIGNLREAAEELSDESLKMAQYRRQEYGALLDGTVGRF
eukprot:CAMPEP_0196576826 /NCGR_PEP_ID=MMETSP1081-20130531/5996_1 /TAXON_ID=36882 /ORGANISM="Pyramimonas amylifera, Strain CCMP720" /LENGTH=153 /DNA_ID=CAMNT_0041895537 /DNA_START=398 /DNA_END=859 /DNA_ORIENTATION=+